MRTLLSYLRLMRFPLVFTAIGDAWAVRWMAPGSGTPPVGELAILAATSFCLYGLGMVLNDVIDARRDATAAPRRPIPAGQISASAGAAFALVLAGGAILFAWAYGHPTGGGGVPASVWIAGFVLLMIVAYDTGAKKLPLVGLLLLGLIRAAQCQLSATVGPGYNAPAWNSLFLFSHVTVVSWIAYNWEDKRPRIRTATRWGLAFAVVAIDVVLFDAFSLSRVAIPLAGTDAVEWVPAGRFLVFPLIAAGTYAVVLLWILFSPKHPAGPDKGRMAIRLGLIWLLVYDAAFCAAAGRWTGAAAEAGLLVLTLLSSRAMIALGRRHA